MNIACCKLPQNLFCVRPALDGIDVCQKKGRLLSVFNKQETTCLLSFLHRKFGATAKTLRITGQYTDYGKYFLHLKLQQPQKLANLGFWLESVQTCMLVISVRSLLSRPEAC